MGEGGVMETRFPPPPPPPPEFFFLGCGSHYLLELSAQ